MGKGYLNGLDPGQISKPRVVKSMYEKNVERILVTLHPTIDNQHKMKEKEQSRENGDYLSMAMIRNRHLYFCLFSVSICICLCLSPYSLSPTSYCFLKSDVKKTFLRERSR